jgi:mono/diheme cytochrome c family protein
VYQQKCSSCHGQDLKGDGFAPALALEAFSERWKDGKLGDLLTVVKVTMPQDQPSTMTDDENGAVVAYLLKRNEYPAGRQELSGNPADSATTLFAKREPPR